MKSRLIESLESRCFLSASSVNVDHLVITPPPAPIMAGERDVRGIEVQIQKADGAIDRSVTGGTLVLEGSVDENAGTPVGSARVTHGIARVKRILLTAVGDYDVVAVYQTLESSESTLNVVAGTEAMMSIAAFVNPAFMGQVDFTATILDKFGNVVTGSDTYIYLWKDWDPLLGIDATGTNQVRFNGGRSLGIQFSQGVAEFSVQANGGARQVSVIFADSNPRVKHVRSLTWGAHL